jgi:hypothetical protein
LVKPIEEIRTHFDAWHFRNFFLYRQSKRIVSSC